MKRIFTLFVALSVVAMTYGQSLQTMTPAAKMTAKKYTGVERAGRSTELGWLSYASYLGAYWDTDVQSGAGNILSIDSLGLVDFSDGNGGTVYDHPWVYSIGQTYDLNASFYDDASTEEDISLTYSGSLNIDSVMFRAFYLRGPNMTPNMVDTIIVGIRTDITEDDEAHFTNIDNSCFYNIDYDFDLAILMYQKEFASRMNGEVGTKDYSRLSAMLYFKCDVEKLTEVSNESFIPKPQIDSTVVRLTPKENSISSEDFKTYSKFTKALFQHRNKKIKNALIDSRHIISDIDKKVLKKRLNAIEDERLVEYLKKRVVVLAPEEILYISEKLNPIFVE